MNRRQFLTIGTSISLTGCGGCHDRFRWVTRLYDGKLYRQFYRKGFERFGRVRTYIRVPSTDPGIPDKWEPSDIDVELGDQIEGRGMQVDDGTTQQPITPDLSPDLVRRQAAVALKPRVYILDIYATDRVVVYDPLTTRVTEKVDLGQQSPVAILLSPNRKNLYVIHARQNAFDTIPARPPALVIFDANPLRITQRIELPNTLVPRLTERSLEITVDGRYLYLLNDTPTGGVILRLDSATGSILNEIPNPTAGDFFGSLRMSPDGSVLYALSSRGLVMIDVRTNTVSNQIVIPVGPSLQVHPNGSTVYVSRIAPIGIAIVDTLSSTVSSVLAIPGGRQTKNIQVTPDGIDLFINDDLGGFLHHIYLPENRLLASIPSLTDGGVIGI